MVVIKVAHNTKESFFRDLPLALSGEIRAGWEIKPSTEISGVLVVKATFLVQKADIIELHEGLIHAEEFPIAQKRSEIIRKAEDIIRLFKEEVRKISQNFEVLEGSYFNLSS